MAKPKDYDFLLLGKTGAGKSATGNSILRRKAFRSSAAMDSVTISSKKEITQLETGRRLLVVDTPGLMDTKAGSKKKGEEMFLTAIKEAMIINPEGYHVCLLTLRFGSRFTEEDLDTVNSLKKVFGENFVQHYCVLILTYGDNFKNALREGDIIEGSFVDWCKAQVGNFEHLLKEVLGRVLLFDNYATDADKESQLNDLLHMVDEQMLTGRRYTNEKLQKVLKSHQEILFEDKTILPTQRAQEETSLIFLEVERIQRDPNVNAKILAFEEMSERINKLLATIDKEEHKSPELGKMRVIVADKKNYVDNEVKTLKLQKEIEDKTKQNEEFRKLLALQDEQNKQVEELKKENGRLNLAYQEARDENNNKKAMSLWEKITSWFPW